MRQVATPITQSREWNQLSGLPKDKLTLNPTEQRNRGPGLAGKCYDNAMMESFWGTLQLEVLGSRTWKTRAELANAIFEWTVC